MHLFSFNSSLRALVFSAVILLIACGQKGDLYLPEASQLPPEESENY